MSNVSFFQRFLSDARQAAGLIGWQTSVVLAQWADETTYGTSSAFVGPNQTWNFAGVSPNGRLGSYPSESAGLAAYIETASQHIYDPVRQAKGFYNQCLALGASPWAGAHYDANNTGTKGVDLINIVKQNNLTQYDAPDSNNFPTLPNGALGPVDPFQPDKSLSPVGSLGPPQLPPPPGLESSISTDTFILNGSQLDANVSGALQNIGMSLDITQASTLTMTLSDPNRELINLSVFQEAAVLNLGGELYELVGVEKSGNNLIVTFELWVVAALRKATGAFSIQPGSMTRTDFARLLVENVETAVFVQAPQPFLWKLDQGAGAASGLQEQLSRGTIDLPLESSWTCLQRIAAEIQWRCFAVGNAVFFGPDSWLIAQPPIAAIQEGQNGVLVIDGTWDSGQPLGTIDVTATAGDWTPPPGTVVTVKGLGVFAGNWLVQTIERKALSQPDISIVLCQAQPSLPEPTSGGAKAATGQQTTAGGTAAQTALAAAQAQLGKPYISAGENPATGFDCSGLTQFAYASSGVTIPRTSQEQQAAGPAVPAGGVNLLPGDLVFFGAIGVPATHVGMFVSYDASTNTAQMIDAPHSGAFVRQESFTPDVGAAWGGDVYLGATRPAP